MPSLSATSSAQHLVTGEHPRFRASSTLVRLVVGVPRLVATIGFAIAGDLLVHRLEALTDAFRNRLGRLLAGQFVGDLDTVLDTVELKAKLAQ